jgi:predicted TIM-barrel fold metal-dependent hydrolase
MMIDAHAQFGPGFRTDSPLQPLNSAATADELVAILDSSKVESAVVFAPDWNGGTLSDDFIDPNYELANAAVAEGTKKYPKRLIGFARVDPRFGSRARAELEKCLDQYGFKGLYLSNVGEAFNYRDIALLKPLFEACGKRKRPVMVYTWQSPSQPLQVLPLAKAFPDVPLILAHSGKEMLGDTLLVGDYAPNVYFETSFTGARMAPGAAKRFGVQRVIFGSNAPYGLPHVEANRIKKWGGFNETELAEILGGNIARLVGAA